MFSSLGSDSPALLRDEIVGENHINIVAVRLGNVFNKGGRIASIGTQSFSI